MGPDMMTNMDDHQMMIEDMDLHHREEVMLHQIVAEDMDLLLRVGDMDLLRRVPDMDLLHRVPDMDLLTKVLNMDHLNKADIPLPTTVEVKAEVNMVDTVNRTSVEITDMTVWAICAVVNSRYIMSPYLVVVINRKSACQNV